MKPWKDSNSVSHSCHPAKSFHTLQCLQNESKIAAILIAFTIKCHINLSLIVGRMCTFCVAQSPRWHQPVFSQSPHCGHTSRLQCCNVALHWCMRGWVILAFSLNWLSFTQAAVTTPIPRMELRLYATIIATQGSLGCTVSSWSVQTLSYCS